MRVIIPAAGKGERFRRQFREAKPFIEIQGKPMIQHVIDMFNYEPMDPSIAIYIALQRGHCRGDHLLGLEEAGVRGFQFFDYCTKGTADTVAQTIDAYQFPRHEEIMVVNCDNYTTFPMDMLRSYCLVSQADAGILTFPGNGEARYSYAKGLPWVEEVKEKIVISDTAIAGFFWFRNVDILRKAIFDMMGSEDMYNNEYYLAPALNYVEGKVLNIFLPREEVYTWGTPDELHNFLSQGITIKKEKKL